MRWFKHMTATKDDEKIVELLAIGGLEAYGFYWAVIELIARQMEKESDKCSVTYPLPYLSRQLYCHHNKATNLLSKLQVTGLMEVNKIEVDGRVNFKITCPNLLKYRDEYSRRKDKTTDNIPTKSRQAPEQETDTDTDTDIDIEQNKDKEEEKTAPNKSAYSLIFENFWSAYPSKVAKGAAAKSFKKALKSASVNEIMSGLSNYCNSRKVAEGIICNPATWLNQERWNDVCEPVEMEIDPSQALTDEQLEYIYEMEDRIAKEEAEKAKQ
jgi:hypothetical protein